MLELHKVTGTLLFVHKFSVKREVLKSVCCDVPVLLYETTFCVLLCSG